MIYAFTVLLCVAAAAYCFGQLTVAAGVRRVFSRKPQPQITTPAVSVIVPARDEASCIERCIRSILKSDYPPERFELIVVDDHSSDDTAEIVSALFDERSSKPAAPRTRLLRSGHGAGGKQHALERGILAASGEIIMTTDADCVVSAGWIRSMVGRFGERVGFVAGPVAYADSPRVLSRAEAIEFLALVSVGAGTIGLGSPTICNSANAAYLKDLYFRQQRQSPPINGAVADETLMHFIDNETGLEVDFCAVPDAVVMTTGSESLQAFLGQRARWASSTRHLVSGSGLVTLVAAFGFFSMMIIGAVWALANTHVAAAFGLAFAFKTVGDAAVVYPFAKRLGLPRSLRALLVAEVLHVPSIIMSVIIASTVDITWKGRTVARYSAGTVRRRVRNPG